MILRWKRRGNVGHRQGLDYKGPQRLTAFAALFYLWRDVGVGWFVAI
jgi:hypothetical protein